MSDFERLVEKFSSDKTECGTSHRGAKGLCCLADTAVPLRKVCVGESCPGDVACYERVVGGGVAVVSAGDESAGSGIEDAVVPFVALAHLVVARILMKERSEDDVPEDVL